MSQFSGSSDTYLNQTCWRTPHKVSGYFRNFKNGIIPRVSSTIAVSTFFHSTGPLHLQEGVPRQQFQCQEFVHKATHFLTGPTFPSAVYEFLSSRCDGNAENYVWNGGTGEISWILRAWKFFWISKEYGDEYTSKYTFIYLHIYQHELVLVAVGWRYYLYHMILSQCYIFFTPLSAKF